MGGKKLAVLAPALLLGLLAPTADATETSAQQVRPSYRRDRVERPAVPAPSRKPLPESLRIAVPREGRDETDPVEDREGAARTRRGAPDRPKADHLEARARQAALWAAREAIERHGRGRYLELGFYEGLHEAFRQTGHTDWDFREGLRFGRLDPQARRLGVNLGYDEAFGRALEEAERAVVAQFADLGREPVRLAAPAPPRFGMPGFHVEPPELRDVFRDTPWRRLEAAHRLDPWRLYRAGRHGDFYDRDWQTARFGLDLWYRHHRQEAWLRRLSADERQRFEAHFRTVYESALARRFPGVAERAFDRGYDAGWRYGIEVHREWQYRRGYHRGFEAAVRDSARATFYDSYRASWAAAYERVFREWSTSLKPELRAVSVRDASDDGIFEPGEELLADLELANLGGASGVLEARLSGPALGSGDRLAIDLPRRSVGRQARPLHGLIPASTAPGTDTTVTVAVGELVERLPLRVSYPLRFEGGLVLSYHDAVGGRAEVDVAVRNQSRRAIAARVEADLPQGTIRRPRRELGEIPAGATRTVRFELEGLHPLELLGGEVVLGVAAVGRGRVHDGFEARLPELATDLGDRSLLDYMLRLARSADARRGEVERAQELMLRRLRVDWQAAAAGRGNPYKQDLRMGTRTTALGDLVATVRAERGTLLDRSVFSGLAPRIEDLSREFRGTHPFLRKSMRKLGRELL